MLRSLSLQYSPSLVFPPPQQSKVGPHYSQFPFSWDSDWPLSWLEKCPTFLFVSPASPSSVISQSNLRQLGARRDNWGEGGHSQDTVKYTTTGARSLDQEPGPGQVTGTRRHGDLCSTVHRTCYHIYWLSFYSLPDILNVHRIVNDNSRESTDWRNSSRPGDL